MKDYKKILLSRIDLKILYLIIIILFSILTFRTVHYIRQVPLINKAIIYQSYNTSSKNLGTLNMGDRVTVLSTKYHWKKVKTSEGEVGWIQDWNFQQQNKITSLSDATIVIDAGHGGSDSGALSRTNKNEKTYTLIYAKKLAERLRKAGAMVYMTRDDDSFVSLNSRPQLAENVHADAFISIHFDSAPENNMGSGYTTYYYHLLDFNVEIGDVVDQNTIIGWVGGGASTSSAYGGYDNCTTGAHLHFGVARGYYNGYSVSRSNVITPPGFPNTYGWSFYSRYDMY